MKGKGRLLSAGRMHIYVEKVEILHCGEKKLDLCRVRLLCDDDIAEYGSE